MPRFLNRLLALPIAEQNQLFAELEDRIAAGIEQAMEAGTYEVGVETVRADSLAAAGRETLYTHPGSGAATELVEIVRRDRLEPTTADAALEIGKDTHGGPVLVGECSVQPGRGRASGAVRPVRRRRRAGTRPPAASRRAGYHGEGRAGCVQLAESRRSRLEDALGGRDRRPPVPQGIAVLARSRSVAAGLGPSARREHAGAASQDRRRRGLHRARARFRAGPRRAFRIRSRGRSRHDRRRSLRGGHGDGEPRSHLPTAGGLRAAASWGPTGSRSRDRSIPDTAVLKRMGCTVEIVSWRTRVFAPGPDLLERVIQRWPLAA